MEEIKEIIEICLLGDCTGCPLHDYSHCRDILLRDTLNVLKDLEKENKDLKSKQTEVAAAKPPRKERATDMFWYYLINCVCSIIIGNIGLYLTKKYGKKIVLPLLSIVFLFLIMMINLSFYARSLLC